MQERDRQRAQWILFEDWIRLNDMRTFNELDTVDTHLFWLINLEISTYRR